VTKKLENADSPGGFASGCVVDELPVFVVGDVQVGHNLEQLLQSRNVLKRVYYSNQCFFVYFDQTAQKCSEKSLMLISMLFCHLS
jgi:hypothetical protein